MEQAVQRSSPRSLFFKEFRRLWDIGSGSNGADGERRPWTTRTFSDAMERAGLGKTDPATIGDWLAGKRLPMKSRKDALLKVFFPYFGDAGRSSSTTEARRRFENLWRSAQLDDSGDNGPSVLQSPTDDWFPYTWAVSNNIVSLSGIVELRLHQPRLTNDQVSLYIDATLIMDTATYEIDGYSVDIGLRRTFLTISSPGYQVVKGSMIGERSESDAFIRRAGGVDIVGPRDDVGCLCGNILRDEYIAEMEPSDPTGDPVITVKVHAGRGNFVVRDSCVTESSKEKAVIPQNLGAEKNAIIDALLYKMLQKDSQGRIIVAEARMRRGTKS